MSRLPLAAVAVAAALSAACAVDAFSGDPFPIAIDRDSGAVMVHIRREAQDAGVAVPAVLDVMAPITVLDPGRDGPARRSSDALFVLVPGADAGADAPAWVPRARLSVAAFEMRPCPGAACQIGRGGAPIEIGAIVGADALAGDAVRFDFSRNQIFILPDIAGDNEARTKVCDSVLPTPFRGGGTLIIDGSEVPFGGRRIAIAACLAPPEYTDTQRAMSMFPTKGGADALFVMSTGLGVSILGKAAYRRLREVTTGLPDESQLPSDSVVLPTGVITGGLVSLPRLALVATTGSNPGSPCHELYAHRYMMVADCPPMDSACPCTDETSCAAPAVVELGPPTAPGKLDVLVVEDSEPVLQALRAELRPDAAEVDGILGTDALHALQIDVDYPHNRVLARCARSNPDAGVDAGPDAGTAACLARPQLAKGNRAAVAQCLPIAPDGGTDD